MAKSNQGFLRVSALSFGMFLSSHGCKNRIESGPATTAPTQAPAPQQATIMPEPAPTPPQTLARPAPRPVPTPPVSALGRNESCGKASYYSDSLAGNPTASGETYSPTKLSAAHLTLPFGTKVTVALKGNKSKRVELKVNDRGPHGDARRILDLSRAAFERLGSTNAGVLDVCMHWSSLE